MNIFFLDRNPQKAAEYHCDKHVLKMIIESAQMLSTAHHMLDSFESPDNLYKVTHVNHPCNVWARTTNTNYNWLYSLYNELCHQFKIRRHKTHKSSLLKNTLAKLPHTIEPGPLTEIPLCMPDIYKTTDPVQAYRNYYVGKYQEGIVAYNWGVEMPLWLRQMI